jgi:cytochrome oxidase Cu insertion factor (SCO1/SenC/PrrC family)
MSELSNIEPQNKSGGRKILLLLGIIFVLPFTLAATLHLLNLRPSGHSYGNLVQPPHALQFPTLHDMDGKKFKREQWLKKWSIVTVIAKECAEPCQAQEHLIKQVHILLDKDAHRLQRVLLVPAEVKGDTFASLQKQYPDLLILTGADAGTAKFAAEFNVIGAQLYLVDER